jgi:hypothetical protein
MKPFNLSRLADSHSAGLIFTCSQCNKVATPLQTKLGCGCGNRLFKASRYLHLITNPLTPYHTDSDEDGYKLTTPGDISTSVGGPAVSILEEGGADSLPKDGTEGEEKGIPGANSDIFLDPHLRDINIKQNRRPGVHNMNGSTISDVPSVFERTRKRIWQHERKK